MGKTAVEYALYETDFVAWSDRTAELLRSRRFDDLDIENVAEEIASLGSAERSSVRSQLQRLMMHKIKQQIQPERNSKSWRMSIEGTRERILDRLEGAPSLKGHLRESLQRVYSWPFRKRCGKRPRLKSISLKNARGIWTAC
jgi:hypothetical protein